jgi:hypothetical protein
MAVKRITISIDESIIKEIKNVQAQRIMSTEKSISFSSVLADLVKESLKERHREYTKFYV